MSMFWGGMELRGDGVEGRRWGRGWGGGKKGGFGVRGRISFRYRLSGD